MRIHVLSDLHIEFADYIPQVLNADVTVLAGDIGLEDDGVLWAINRLPGQVVYVAGNHEYYGTNIDLAMVKMKALALRMAPGRVHVLDRDSVVINGVRFLGATGWTDFTCTGNPSLAMFDAQQSMNDYRKIRHGAGFRKWSPVAARDISVATKSWIRAQLAQPFEGKTVLIMHHAPSVLSLQNSGTIGHMDASYANRWEDLFQENLTIVHGHTHHPVSYTLMGTQVISNPRGYPDESVEGFDPRLVIEI